MPSMIALEVLIDSTMRSLSVSSPISTKLNDPSFHVNSEKMISSA